MEYTNSQIIKLIDEHIHNDRNRKILKDRFVDGMTYERLAERYELSFQQVRTIVYRGQEKLIKYL